MTGHGRGGGKSAAEMKEEARRNMDAQPIITRCAFCKWEYEGTAREGRELAKGHRRVHHPDIVVTRRRRGSLTRHRVSDDSFRDEGRANARKVAESLARLEEAS
jgi:hypothetical protein